MSPIAGREWIGGNYWIDLGVIGVAVNGSWEGRWAYLRVYLGPLRREGSFLAFEIGPGDDGSEGKTRPRLTVVR